MRETLLNHLFAIITALRRIEVRLINDHQSEGAAKLREANKALSSFRDKLITAQLTEATEKLNNATDKLQTASSDLQAYLNTREAAGSRLETILANIPALVVLLNGLTAD